MQTRDHQIYEIKCQMQDYRNEIDAIEQRIFALSRATIAKCRQHLAAIEIGGEEAEDSRQIGAELDEFNRQIDIETNARRALYVKLFTGHNAIDALSSGEAA